MVRWNADRQRYPTRGQRPTLAVSPPSTSLTDTGRCWQRCEGDASFEREELRFWLDTAISSSPSDAGSARLDTAEPDASRQSALSLIASQSGWFVYLSTSKFGPFSSVRTADVTVAQALKLGLCHGAGIWRPHDGLETAPAAQPDYRQPATCLNSELPSQATGVYGIGPVRFRTIV